MRVKPAKSAGNVLVEVGPRDAQLLANKPEDRGFRLKKILVPIDFSDRSTKALQYAISFSRQFRAEILCLHVIEIPYGAGEAGLVAEMERFRKDMLKETKRRMDDLLAREAAELPGKGAVRSGVPYHEITKAAQEEDIDLIIIGTHGRTGFSRFFLGSTTERVVRHAHCPVLVVREQEHEFISTTAAKAQTHRRARKAA
jgi:universal stress protein A